MAISNTSLAPDGTSLAHIKGIEASNGHIDFSLVLKGNETRNVTTLPSGRYEIRNDVSFNTDLEPFRTTVDVFSSNGSAVSIDMSSSRVEGGGGL
jgi:hypothetical protein